MLIFLGGREKCFYAQHDRTVVILYPQWYSFTPVECPPACQPILPPCNQHCHLHRPCSKVPPPVSAVRIGKIRKEERREERNKKERRRLSTCSEVNTMPPAHRSSLVGPSDGFAWDPIVVMKSGYVCAFAHLRIRGCNQLFFLSVGLPVDCCPH